MWGRSHLPPDLRDRELEEGRCRVAIADDDGFEGGMGGEPTTRFKVMEEERSLVASYGGEAQALLEAVVGK
jgi:hypothetical protein